MSQDALEKISSSISKTKNNVKLILGNMDNLDSLVNSEKFDLVSSCFALYYSENIPLLIQKIKKPFKIKFFPRLRRANLADMMS